MKTILILFLVSFRLAFAAERMRDPKSEVFVGERIVSYDEALPVLTQMLGGSLEERIQASASLMEFGDSLLGTPALDALVAIVEKKDDLSILDAAFAAARTANGKVPPPLSTGPEKTLAGLVESKSNALTAIVMSGAAKWDELLKRYQQSPSETERLIAEQATKLQAEAGTWKRGRIATKGQPRLYPFQGTGLKRDDYLRKISTRLSSSDDKAIQEAIASLDSGANAMAITNSPVVEQLIKLFGTTNVGARQRESIVKIIGLSEDDRALQFLKGAVKAEDENVREMAQTFLLPRKD